MLEKVLEAIREAIETRLYLSYDEKTDIYSTEIYTDYRDELGEQYISKILKDKSPLDTFYEIVDECYMDASDDQVGYIIQQIGEYFQLNDMGAAWDENEDAIHDWIINHISVNIPYRRFLDQDVRVDIIVDTGDEDHDYVLNCVYPHYNGRFGELVDEKASILWLARQQGYTKHQLNKALRYYEYNGSKFLKSMAVEVLNCSTHMNALTFFVSLTLMEAISLKERVATKKKGDYIVLDKETRCGLCDFWNGGGGVLEIALEKDVLLPIKLISSAFPDGCRGTGVGEIYGDDGSLHEYGGIKAFEPEKSAA